MSIYHVVAATVAAVNVAALAADTVILAVTGERTFVTDDSTGTTATAVGSSIALGLTFAVLCWVVVRERESFEHPSRVVRALRPALTASLVLLAVGFVTITPVQQLTGTEQGALYNASGLVAMLALGMVFLSGVVIGLIGLRTNRFGVGGRVLAALVPVIAVTVLIALVAPTFASPVYITAVVITGLALLGLGANRVDGIAAEQAAARTS